MTDPQPRRTAERAQLFDDSSGRPVAGQRDSEQPPGGASDADAGGADGSTDKAGVQSEVRSYQMQSESIPLLQTMLPSPASARRINCWTHFLRQNKHAMAIQGILAAASFRASQHLISGSLNTALSTCIRSATSPAIAQCSCAQTTSSMRFDRIR
jgi:hypothetical protein